MASTCARCGKDDGDYSDLTRTLLYSRKCGHSLCVACAAQVLSVHAIASLVKLPVAALTKASADKGRGAAAATRGNTYMRCPAIGCDITLSVADLSDKTTEVDEFERECEVRRRCSRIFNKTLENFGGDARAYNDYLEMVEANIGILVSGSDAERDRVEQSIRSYMATNQSAIALNAARREAVTRTTTEKLASDAASRVAAAETASSSLSVERQEAERVKSQLMSLLLGDRKLSDEQRKEVRARLMEMQSALRATSGSPHTRSSVYGDQAIGSGTAVASSGSMFVPCPLVHPPKCLSAERRAHSRQLPQPKRIPLPLSDRLRRAGGLERAFVYRVEAAELAMSLYVTHSHS